MWQLELVDYCVETFAGGRFHFALKNVLGCFFFSIQFGSLCGMRKHSIVAESDCGAYDTFVKTAFTIPRRRLPVECAEVCADNKKIILLKIGILSSIVRAILWHIRIINCGILLCFRKPTAAHSGHNGINTCIKRWMTKERDLRCIREFLVFFVFVRFLCLRSNFRDVDKR